MNSAQIFDILKKHPITRKEFFGVFTADRIVKPQRFPSSIVVNTDDHKGPGKHWIALYFPDHQTAHYFDSLGSLPSSYPLIHQFIQKNFKIVKTIISKKRPIQLGYETSCGPHVVYYLITKNILALPQYPDYYSKIFTYSLIN